MGITTQQLNEILARKAMRARNPDRSQSAGPVVEHGAGNAPHGDRAVKAPNPRKRLVRITCYRAKHLQDPDNGIYKWHIDAIRRAGIVDDDTADAIKLEIQPDVKVATLEEERTEIYVEPINEQNL